MGHRSPPSTGRGSTPQLSRAFSPHFRTPAETPKPHITLQVDPAPLQPRFQGPPPPSDTSVPFAGDRLRQTENRATRCKVERLQLLMQQKRLRRKARRDARAPYHWLPNRKSSRTNSNSSVSSEGSLDLDFEDSVWKPEVKADIKSEFVVA